MEYALPVQSYPQADSAERLLPFAETSVRKVDLRLVGLEVNVCEYEYVVDLVLKYLSPPAGPFPCVVLLPALITHLLEYPYHASKVVPRAAICVVVVVAPS